MSYCQDRRRSNKEKRYPERNEEVRCSRGHEPAANDPGQPIRLEGLPTINSVKDMAKAYDIVIEAMSNGEITPDEAEIILPLLEGKLEVARNWMNDEIWPNPAGVAGASNENPTA